MWGVREESRMQPRFMGWEKWEDRVGMSSDENECWWSRFEGQDWEFRFWHIWNVYWTSNQAFGYLSSQFKKGLELLLVLPQINPAFQACRTTHRSLMPFPGLCTYMSLCVESVLTHVFFHLVKKNLSLQDLCHIASNSHNYHLLNHPVSSSHWSNWNI